MVFNAGAIKPVVVPPSTPTLIVPTKDRPRSLIAVLRYLSLFYPGARVIVADGSVESFQQQNERNIADASLAADLTYRKFPAELPLLDRMGLLLSSLPEAFYIVGADDDFPVLETLAKAADFLAASPDYAICGGVNVQLQIAMDRPCTMSLLKGHSVLMEDTKLRCLQYAKDQFPTYYCVATRSHLLSRYERLRLAHVIGYTDYMIGLHDLVRGKLKVLSDITFIRTVNSRHSYVRSNDKLRTLKEADTLLRSRELVRDDLIRFAGLTHEKADDVSTNLLLARIRYMIGADGEVADEVVSTAAPSNYQRIFAMLADPESQMAKRYADRLDYVRGELSEIVESGDNGGSPRFRAEL